MRQGKARKAKRRPLLGLGRRGVRPRQPIGYAQAGKQVREFGQQRRRGHCFRWSGGAKLFVAVTYIIRYVKLNYTISRTCIDINRARKDPCNNQ